MMEVFFNSQKIPWILKDIQEIPSLLEHLEKEYLAPDNFISDVFLDGTSLIHDGNLDLQLVSTSLASTAKTLRVSTCTISQLAQDAVGGAQKYLTGLDVPVTQVSNQLITGEFEKAMKNLAILMEGIWSLISLLGSLETSYHLNYSQIRVNGVTIRSTLQKTSDLLQEIVRAQEMNDNITIADLLEYELKPQLKEWGHILEILGNEVRVFST